MDHRKSWRKFSAICVSKWLPTLVIGEVTRVQPSLVWRFWWDKSQNFSLGPATWENRPHLHYSHVYYFSLLLSVTFFKPGQFFFFCPCSIFRGVIPRLLCVVFMPRSNFQLGGNTRLQFTHQITKKHNLSKFLSCVPSSNPTSRSLSLFIEKAGRLEPHCCGAVS